MITKTSFYGLAMTKVQFVGSAEANYLDFISANLSAEAITSILVYFKRKYKWNIIDLIDIKESSVLLKLLKSGMPRIPSLAILESEVCPYVSVETGWDEFLHLKMKRKARYNLQRQIKQLESLGKLEFKIARESANWDGLIHQAVRLYQKDWQNKYNLSSFLNAEYSKFYVDIAAEFAKNGWSCFSYLLLNNEMIAFSYGMTCGGRFIDYIVGYDRGYSRFSPGSCLLRLQLEEIFRNKLKEFDFSKGQEPYKSKWMTAERKNYRVIISNHGFYSRLVWIHNVIYHRLRFFCKRSLILRNLRKRVLGALRRSARASGD
jgi:CelD/BcsL family acetyltransferase involved in cellulose biosynthesis